jgi:hypothetical protein
MYAVMVEAEFILQNFLVSWWALSNKDELVRRGLAGKDHFCAERDESMQKRGEQFCDRYLSINATLHRNAIFFDDQFVENVLGAYKPIFDMILEFDYSDPPPIPEEYKRVVEAGRAPRKTVVEMFRGVLGVAATKV